MRSRLYGPSAAVASLVPVSSSLAQEVRRAEPVTEDQNIPTARAVPFEPFETPILPPPFPHRLRGFRRLPSVRIPYGPRPPRNLLRTRYNSILPMDFILAASWTWLLPSTRNI